MTGALQAVRVIDMTRVLAGPMASMMLADMGAEVIKIEEREGGDLLRTSSSLNLNGEGVNFLSANRNKKSVALDITCDAGYEVLLKLVAGADVFIENFRPGVTAKLRVDYERLRAVNPRLVYCSITGFGSSGPYRNRAAVDPVIQAESGIMSLTGEQGGAPVRIGTAVGDIYGGMLAAQGIGFALFARERTGAGQKVELALLDASLFGLMPREGEFFASGQEPPRMGSGHPLFVPFQGFATSDGHVFVAAFHDGLFRKLCGVLGCEQLAADPDFATNAARHRNRARLLPVLESIFATRTSEDWIARLEPLGIPIGRINTLADVFAHPQVRHNGMVQEMDHPVAGRIRVLNNPLRFSGTPTSLHSPPPVLGQHTRAVLAAAGYDDAAYEALQRAGAVA